MHPPTPYKRPRLETKWRWPHISSTHGVATEPPSSLKQNGDERAIDAPTSEGASPNPPRAPRPGWATFRVDTGVRWPDLCGRCRAGPKAGQEPSPRAKIGGSTGGGPTVPKRKDTGPQGEQAPPEGRRPLPRGNSEGAITRRDADGGGRKTHT